MKRRRLLWTPWRGAYVGGPKPPGCIFCALPAEGPERDRDNGILFRAARCFGILNRFPYTSGHLMVVPYVHVGSLGELDPTTHAELLALVQRSIDALTRAMNPDGFNVGLNLGRAAGAGIADHLHIHVVPRWIGDSNFIPVLADTRLIPEDLPTTWDKLRAAGIADDPDGQPAG